MNLLGLHDSGIPGGPFGRLLSEMPSQWIDGRAEYTNRDTILFLFFDDNAIMLRRTCTPRRAFHHVIISVILDNLVHYQSGPSCSLRRKQYL